MIHDDGVFNIQRSALRFAPFCCMLSNDARNTRSSSQTKPFCKLLVLHKSDYDSIIRNYQESIRTEAYKVLKGVSLFSHWSRSRLERVCRCEVTRSEATS